MSALLRLRGRLRRAPDAAALFDAVAESVGRLAGLVAAGAGAADAWHHLAQHSADEGERRLARDAAVALASGAPPLPAFRAVAAVDPVRGPAWVHVGLLLTVATDAGAPLGPALERAADGLRAAADLQRSIRAAVAGPAASGRIMLALPPGTALLGWGLGFDVPGVLLGRPAGWVLAGLAAALLVVAFRWSARLTRRAADVPWQRGLGVDLAAVVVRAGLPPAAALDRLEHLRPMPPGVDLDADRRAVARTVDFAARGGVPLAALLESEATRIRRETAAHGGTAANALPTRLLLPLGLLVLPAFVLVGVVPIGLAVLSSTALSI